MAKDQGKISLNSTTRVRITIIYIEHLNVLRCSVQFLRSGRSRHVGAFFSFHLFVERYLLGTCYNLMERIWNLLFLAKNLQK